MGVSWHRHNFNSNGVDFTPYFWLLIALLGLLSPLECAHWNGIHNIAMAISLALTMWLAFQLSDWLLAIACVWMVYELWCMLSYHF